MARKNCPVCGGFLKVAGGCTKCENRHWYRRVWRRCRTGLTRTVSFVETYWAPLLIVALLLALLFVGLQGKSEPEPLQARVTQLEETVADLEEATARLESQADRLEALVQALEESVAHLEKAVAENTAAVEELQRLVEELQQQAEPSETNVSVKQGDTVWDLLTEELGRYPTWEEIQKVVDANNLGNFMDGQGRWIVLIYPGQVLDLSPALGP